MKQLLLLTALSLTLLVSCTKQKDDPQENPLLSKTELLVQHAWWVDELFHRLEVGTSHYKRGGTNTTGITYDNMRFTFKENGTGTHIDQNGYSHAFTWQFTTSDERNIHITINGGPSYDWSLVEITDEAVHATVAITVTGEDILESFRLKPAAGSGK